MIHLTWIIFSIIVVFLLYKILFGYKQTGGYINIDFETPLWIIALLFFIGIWGGIFWW